MTYEKAGVPHLKGDPGYNRKIVSLIRSTHRSGVIGNPSGFAALFDLKKLSLRDPLLVTSTDGVGTKLELARLRGKHDTIGIDLVAMCVNDVITCGAQPVLFLDYYATGQYEPSAMFEILRGVTRGCKDAGCALVGGETAIMPGFYGSKGSHSTGQYDLAGFCVGVVERKKLITGRTLKAGDAVLGLASSGFHSNGYSLLRKIYGREQLLGEIGKKLLTPTRIYVKPLLKLLKALPVKGIANITGGGFYDNIPRVMPEGLTAQIHAAQWPVPKLFESTAESGNITPFEMFRTFNMGIGMVLMLDPRYIVAAQKQLLSDGISSWKIGTVVPGKKVTIDGI
ncbi:MAG: phosphoribosylformylglycinamidine cyclo-ligase [Omnitrophica bacterium GWA2_52_8]|nr:MAG: phosphoribosylformylglycinamidine cyclo-ligase [Omnitrophica bacterium GWA2_52_8]